MSWQHIPFVLTLFVASLVSAALALYAWRRRSVTGAIPFACLMLGIAEWTLAYAFELWSADLPAKLLSARFEYLGIVVVPPLGLVLALEYTGRKRWVTRRNLALLAAGSAFTLVVIWTNDLHKLFWTYTRLDASNSIAGWELGHGVAFWTWIAYSYSLLLVGLVILFKAFLRSPPMYRGQAGALLIGALLPWVSNVLTVFGLNPFPGLDLTPFAFTLSGLSLGWGLFRFRLLDVVPVARDAVIEGMGDGVIVLDAQDRVVDLNPAAERIVGYTLADTIGQPVAQVLCNWPGLCERLSDEVEGTQLEIALGEGVAERAFGVGISPLRGRGGIVTGRLIVLRDITERVRAEDGLREAHDELERRVEERTSALRASNTRLQQEIAERKRAEEEIRRRTAQVEALRQVGLELTAQLDLDTLLHSIVLRAMELLGGTGSDIVLYRPARDVLEVVASIGESAVPIGSVFQLGDGLSGKVWETGEPLVVDNYQRWEGRAATREGSPAFAVVGVPIGWGTAGREKEFLGTLVVLADVLRKFSSDDVEVLGMLATHAAIAIRNVRLYDERQRRALEQRTLREAALALTTTLDRDEVIERILAQLKKVVPYDSASVQLFKASPGADQEGGWFEIVGGRGFPNLTELFGTRFLVGDDNPNREVVRSRAPFIVEDAPALYRGFRHAPHDRISIRSWLGVPMLVGERLVGMIALDKRERGFYTQAHARLAEGFAVQAAIAVENSRLYRELQGYTEQLEAQVRERTAQILAQYARLEAVLHSTTDGIIVTDRGGEILETNPVARTWLTRALSLEDAEHLRGAVWDLARQVGVPAAPGEHPERVLELTGLDLQLEAALISEPTVEETVRLDFDDLDKVAQGEPSAVVVAIHDVSHLKALDRMKTRFVTTVSHELRTPVAAIKLYAYLMQRRPEQWQKYLDTLVQEADHQARLVEDILQISRIDAGRLEMRPELISLNELTERVIASRQLLARDQGLVLEHRPMRASDAESGLLALVDPKRMMQVLHNLVENAIRYTPKGGRVVVFTGEQEADGRLWVTATVSDTGIGIPGEELPHVFERFFRGAEPRSMQVSGTGLGLAIAEEIVALHGGRITVESQVGKGSTFTVWLPLADVEA
jgi:PAS domain S-box-containing protein